MGGPTGPSDAGGDGRRRVLPRSLCRSPRGRDRGASRRRAGGGPTARTDAGRRRPTAAAPGRRRRRRCRRPRRRAADAARRRLGAAPLRQGVRARRRRRTDAGMPFRLVLNHVSQFKYTNTMAVEQDVHDHLGVVKEVLRRNDIQLTRDVFYFSGYVFDPPARLQHPALHVERHPGRRPRPGTSGSCSTRRSRCAPGSSRCRACAA